MAMFRPDTLGEVIGLDKPKQVLAVAINASRTRNKGFPHFLISGGPGLGKSTIASIIAKYTNGVVHYRLGTDLRNENDIYSLAQQCKDGDIIFVDEAHVMGSRAVIPLLTWMEDGKIPSPNGPQVVAKAIFLFPTTNAGKMSNALRSRCKTIHIDYYKETEIAKIITQCLDKCKSELDGLIDYSKIDPVAIEMLAQSSRGTPRIAIEQRLEPLIDFMLSYQSDLTVDLVTRFMDVHEIHPLGLESQDMKYCEKLAEQMSVNGATPVSANAMSQITGLSSDVIEEVIEPFLNKIGFIAIHPRGRSLTKKAWKKLGFDKQYGNPAKTASVSDPEIPFTTDSMKKAEQDAEEILAGEELINSAVEHQKTIVKNNRTLVQQPIMKSVESKLNMSTSNTPESLPTPIAKDSDVINWAEIEGFLNNGKFKLQNYAVAKNISASDLRTAFIARYGNRVKGQRGRGGGFVWAN